MRPAVTQDRLKQILHYDPETGAFTNLIHRFGTRGRAEAGWVDSRGYRWIVVDKYKDSAHRWAWLYMTGEWPADTVDHIDRSKDNNRWANLRAATRKQNSENKGHPRGTQRGVYPRRGKWHVQIVHRLRTIYLGTYDSYEDAVHIRRAAERLIYTHSEAGCA